MKLHNPGSSICDSLLCLNSPSQLRVNVNAEVFVAFYFLYCFVLQAEWWSVEQDSFLGVDWVWLGVLTDMKQCRSLTLLHDYFIPQWPICNLNRVQERTPQSYGRRILRRLSLTIKPARYALMPTFSVHYRHQVFFRSTNGCLAG